MLCYLINDWHLGDLCWASRRGTHNFSIVVYVIVVYAYVNQFAVCCTAWCHAHHLGLHEQNVFFRYIDGINKRRAEGKQTSRLGQTNAAGLSKPGLASWKNREAINEILPSQKTGHVESDPEEEKDDYFSDASEEL